MKQYKPLTPSLRRRTIIDRKESGLSKDSPVKSLVKGFSKNGGRNIHGRITSYHKGGGHKQLLRKIDLKRNLFEVPGVVRSIDYDPTRTSWLARVSYYGLITRYIIANNNLVANDVVMSGNKADGNVTGHTCKLKDIKENLHISNIQLSLTKIPNTARSAGSYGQILSKDNINNQVTVLLPSGTKYIINDNCKATVGVVSNTQHNKIVGGKAGYSRWLGIRPRVRGVAMNPIDHPHGGGEGKSSGGRCSVSPWGRLTKGGYKTVRNKYKLNNPLIIKKKK